MAELSELLDKTLVSVEKKQDYQFEGDNIVFTTNDGSVYVLGHYQDCCEHVYIEDICGDLEDLVGKPILIAEELVNENETPEGLENPGYEDTYTWTFYKFATFNGFVDIRWFGSSNGYYSERVSFEKVK